MLDSLDTVDWSAVTHAYGAATELPELLRSLQSPQAEVREQAIWELHGNIWHQGTVYPASAKAVPFLHELLAAPSVKGKSEIAHLLAAIADGRGYFEVHAVGKFGEPTWRKILGDQGKSLEEELAKEEKVLTAVRQASSIELPMLMPYLTDAESETRLAVAEALGKYPEHAILTLPALKAAAKCEASDEIQKAIKKSIDALDQPKSLDVRAAQ